MLALAEGGATVPFIARYRKEQTGNLDEVAIRQVIDAKERWDELVKRQGFIVEEIGRQGKLTPELEARIRGTFDTRRARGPLSPLQAETKDQGADGAGGGAGAAGRVAVGLRARGRCRRPDARSARRRFRRRGKGRRRRGGGAGRRVRTSWSSGCRRTRGLRQQVRSAYFERGCARTRKGEKAKTPSRFENYFAYQEPVKELLKPAELAPLPGDAARLDGGGAGADAGRALWTTTAPRSADGRAGWPRSRPRRARRRARRSPARRCSSGRRGWRCAGTSTPSIETEVHKALREVADAAAITVFAENVRKLLLAAPFGPKPVLGVDPGCAPAASWRSSTRPGATSSSGLMHLETPARQGRAPRRCWPIWRRRGASRAVAVGNGTAGRETETFVREALRHFEAAMSRW